MVQGPNDLEALNPALQAQAQSNQAQRHRPVQENPLVQPADTVQLSLHAVQAAENAAAARNAVSHDIANNVADAAAAAPPAPLNLAPPPVPGVPPAVPPRVPNVGGITAPPPSPPAGAPATVAAESTPAVRTLAAAWAGSAARNAALNEPEVRPDRVAQAARSLASLDNQGAGAVNARISEKLLTGF